MGDKVFRDPLYNYISIDRDQDSWLLELLDCPEVQRLRRIHQLGVSSYTYPGADHNRLVHSLGVVHLMQQVFIHLERVSGAQKVKSARQALIAAALLHDVGHGPYSHLFEPCLGIDHEEWSVAIILDEGSNVHKILKGQGAYLPQHVADLIQSDNATHPAWQKALLSSQLDVDRLDYLRRDSLFTGAGYGHFDWHRLLTTVEFFGEEVDLVWPEKSALAIEEYIFARYYMYQNVYLHKTTRGFEVLLQAMWRRANQLRQQEQDVLAVPALAEYWKVAAPSPATLPTKSYLDIEEFVVLSQIQAWKNHPDPGLADCARRFLNRGGLAMIDPPAPPNPLAPDYGDWNRALQEIIEKKGFAPAEMYCLADTVRGKYRQPYRPEPEPQNQTAMNSIRIRVPGANEPVEIATYLPRLAAVTKPIDRVRYYVPKEVRAEAERLRQEWKT